MKKNRSKPLASSEAHFLPQKKMLEIRVVVTCRYLAQPGIGLLTFFGILNPNLGPTSCVFTECRVLMNSRW